MAFACAITLAGLAGIANASITIPQGITSYVAITLANNQSQPTPVNFQQQITINGTEYANYAADNFENVEFFYQNGTIIPSWLEGSALTPKSDSPLTSQSDLNYWLKLAPQIPASGQIVIYMGFASKSTNLFNGVNIGEAPQLSCSNPANTTTGCSMGQYAEYDNGGSIFSFYDNFAGSSVNASNWNTVGDVGVANSLIISNTMNDSRIVTKLKVYNPSDVYFDALWNAVTAGSGTSSSNIMVFGFFGNAGLGIPGYNALYFRVQLAGWIGVTTANALTYNSLQPSLSLETPGYYVFSLFNNGGTDISDVDYKAVQSQKYESWNGSSYLGFENNYKGLTYNSLTVQWVRTRLAPPDGVMPAENISAIHNSLSTFTVSNPIAVLLNVSQGLNDTVLGGASGGTPPYSYQWYARYPGSSDYVKMPGSTSANLSISTSNITALGTYLFEEQATDSESPPVMLTSTSAAVLVIPNTICQEANATDIHVPPKPLTLGQIYPSLWGWTQVNTGYARMCYSPGYGIRTNIDASNVIAPKTSYIAYSYGIRAGKEGTSSVHESPQAYPALFPINVQKFLSYNYWSSVNFSMNPVQPYTTYNHGNPQWHDIIYDIFLAPNLTNYDISKNTLDLETEIFFNSSTPVSASSGCAGLAGHVGNATFPTYVNGKLIQQTYVVNLEHGAQYGCQNYTATYTSTNTYNTAKIAIQIGNFIANAVQLTGQNKLINGYILEDDFGTEASPGANSLLPYAGNYILWNWTISNFTLYNSTNRYTLIQSHDNPSTNVTLHSPGAGSYAEGSTISLAAYAVYARSPVTYNFTFYDAATNEAIGSSVTSSNSINYKIPAKFAGDTIYANVTVPSYVTLPPTVSSLRSPLYTITTGSSSTSTTAPTTLPTTTFALVPVIVASPSSVVNGSATQITITGSGFTPGGSVSMTMSVSGKTLQTWKITANAAGKFTKGGISPIYTEGAGESMTFNATDLSSQTSAYAAVTVTSSTTTTIATTTIPSGGSGAGGGGSGGAAGAGGSQKPTAVNITNGYSIVNFTQNNAIDLRFANTTLKVTENYITPTSAGISINNESFALLRNVTAYLGNLSGIGLYADLVNISYLPIQDTIKIDIFANATSANAGAPMLYVYNLSANSGIFSSNISKQRILAFNLTYLKLYVIASTQGNRTAPINLSFSSPARVSVPDNYSVLLLANMDVSSPDSLNISANFDYPCTDSVAAPYEFSNGSWNELTAYTNDYNSCMLSFTMPQNATIGIFANNMTSAATTSYTTIATTTANPPTTATQSNIQLGVYLVLAAVVLAVAVMVVYFVRRRGRLAEPIAQARPSDDKSEEQGSPAENHVDGQDGESETAIPPETGTTPDAAKPPSEGASKASDGEKPKA